MRIRFLNGAVKEKKRPTPIIDLILWGTRVGTGTGSFRRLADKLGHWSMHVQHTFLPNHAIIHVLPLPLRSIADLHQHLTALEGMFNVIYSQSLLSRAACIRTRAMRPTHAPTRATLR